MRVVRVSRVVWVVRVVRAVWVVRVVIHLQSAELISINGKFCYCCKYTVNPLIYSLAGQNNLAVLTGWSF